MINLIQPKGWLRRLQVDQRGGGEEGGTLIQKYHVCVMIRTRPRLEAGLRRKKVCPSVLHGQHGAESSPGTDRPTVRM